MLYPTSHKSTILSYAQEITALYNTAKDSKNFTSDLILALEDISKKYYSDELQKEWFDFMIPHLKIMVHNNAWVRLSVESVVEEVIEAKPLTSEVAIFMNTLINFHDSGQIVSTRTLFPDFYFPAGNTVEYSSISKWTMIEGKVVKRHEVKANSNLTEVIISNPAWFNYIKGKDIQIKEYMELVEKFNE